MISKQEVVDIMARIESEGIEREALTLIVERMSAIRGPDGQPVFSDFSPSSPQMVLAQAIAALSGMTVFYAHNIPLLVEEHLVRNLMAAEELGPQPAVVNVVAELYEPAPTGGFSLAPGTEVSSGDLIFRLLSPLIIPEGKLGTERLGTEYLYFAPARCLQPGSRGNIAEGSPLNIAGIIPNLNRLFAGTPGIGGREGESYEEMLERLFRRSFNDNQVKLILPSDFHAYVQTRLGQGARSHIVTPPPVPGYHSISILHANGMPLDEEDGILAELNERSPLAPVRYEPPLIVTVNITATLYYDPRQVGSAQLETAATNTLAELLRPQTWDRWGATNNKLSRSRISSLLQGLPGVISVELTAPATDVDLGQPHAAPTLGSVDLTLLAEE